MMGRDEAESGLVVIVKGTFRSGTCDQKSERMSNVNSQGWELHMSLHATDFMAG